MDLIKHISFFDPINIKEEIHIIGVGAIGSNIATMLVRLGLEKLHIWDFDTVDDHNITNQAFYYTQLDMPKTEALEKILLDINPQVKIIKHGKYEEQLLKGYVFLAVDSVELRFKIASILEDNYYVLGIIDSRIGLEAGQVFTVSKREQFKNFLDVSNFKDSEADAPVSACGTSLSVLPTVLQTCSYAVANFINIINKVPEIPFMIQFNSFTFKTKAIK